MSKEIISNLIYLSLPMTCFAAFLMTIVFIVHYLNTESGIYLPSIVVEEIQVEETRKTPSPVHAIEKITVSTKRLRRTPNKV
jgi:hypothetical protein